MVIYFLLFQGGRHSDDESNYITAVRETKEEIGLDLESDSFEYCGQSDSVTVQTSKPFKVAVYIFFQISEDTPSLILEPKEVDSVRWVSLDTLCFSTFLEKDVEYPLARYYSAPVSFIFKLCGLTILYFPGIILPPTDEEFDNALHEYHLWGMTYGITKVILNPYLKPNSNMPFTTKNYVVDAILQFIKSKLTRSKL